MQYGNRLNTSVKHSQLPLFKSYYVVWKPGYSNNYGQIRASLNRTMQYGNSPSNAYLAKEIIPFKSYYVVWKLNFIEDSQGQINCLNRTMQYGNSSISNISSF